MRKFLIGAVLLLLIVLGGSYAILYQGIYFDLHPNAPIQTPYRTEGTSILIQQDTGAYTPLIIKGVDLSASMPGQYATSFAPEEEDYLRWLKEISRMGANTVRVYTVMDDDFYNAFYTYNTTEDTPLYLLQGLLVSDSANTGAKDAYAEDFFQRLITDGLDTVDIIHGRKIINTNEMRGTGSYFHDISPWVLGYLVGQEWNASSVAYTDHRTIHPTAYDGTYFTTAASATPFETMLAQVMDRIITYETQKYKTQRLISFINDPANDPFEYEISYAKQLNKYSSIDAEHILPTDRLISGYFASYRLYDFCDSFTQYLSQEQKEKLGSLLSCIDTQAIYGGYLQLLSAYHTMPVVAAGYGFSTSRGAVTDDQAPITEEEQGRALMEVYCDAVEAGWSGVFLSTWQDTWERRTWNTSFATVLTRNYLWHDLQSDGQNYGIMAFEPGEDERICTVNGNPEEWSDEDMLLSSQNMTLSVKTDTEGIYLLIQGEDLASKTLYLPLDTTQESGSTSPSSRGISKQLSCERAVDFLLCLNGTDDTRLLVQERYDALRENFLSEITGENPFIDFPETDSPVFVPIGMALQNNTLVNEEVVTTAEEAQELRALGVWETGKLIHGNADPDCEDYNSLADFCFGENCVEICLPWLLLNVGDPSQMQIHSDYYQNFGVLTHSAEEFWFGLGDGSETIQMISRPMEGYQVPTWHERLKKSYVIIQEQWKGGTDHAA